MEYHYLVLNPYFEDLEELLNDIESLASGAYKILSIAPDPNCLRVAVVLRFDIAEVEFDEQEIRKRLGL